MSYVKTAAVLTNLLVLSFSIYWTATSWLGLTPRPAFVERNCTIETRQLSHDGRNYRNEFVVSLETETTDAPAKLPSMAFRYGSGVYNQTLRQASAFRGRFRDGGDYVCWIEPPGEVIPWLYTISLTYPNSTPTPRQTDMAMISTLFTTTVVIAIVFQLFCLHVNHTVPIPIQQPTQPQLGLDTERIELVCTPCDKTDVDCAICLEENDSPVAKLPCHHTFHMVCVKRWLIRGGRCPLCNWDLSQDYEVEIPQVEEIEPRSGINEAVTDVVRNTSWRKLIDHRSCDERKNAEYGEASSSAVGREESLSLLNSGSGSVSLRRRKSSLRGRKSGLRSGDEDSKTERS